MRHIIYLGQSDNKAVYYDIKNRIALEAPKSKNLNIAADKKVGGLVYLILFSFFLLGLMMRNLGIPSLTLGTYTSKTLMILGITWLIEFLFVILYVEKRFYRYVAQSQPTDKITLTKAIDGNLFWQSFSDKLVTKKNVIWSIFILSVVLLPLIGGGILLTVWSSGNVEMKPGQYGFTNLSIGSEILILSLLGFYFGGIYAILFQNNPFLFFKAVKEIQSGK